MTAHVASARRSFLRAIGFALTLAVVPSSMPVALGRSACPGCAAGNDSAVPPGFFQDQHPHGPGQISSSDGLATNDGRTFVYPHEAALSGAMSFAELQTLVREAASRNDAYAIWRADYQGLPPDGSRLDANARNYVVPSEADAEALLGILQGQL